MSVDSSKYYDVLIPIELHPGLGFTGQSARSGGSPGTRVSFNNEKALTIWDWEASLHETVDHLYLIVRTRTSEADARATVTRILAGLPSVSVFLDAGVRATSTEPVLATDAVDLTQLSIFNAGIMPHTSSALSTIGVTVHVEALSAAFDARLPDRPNIDRAAEVYADIDFEASTTSRLVLAATVLELLATKSRRDAAALAIIDRWVLEAKAADRPDLIIALDLIREQSITSSIRELMRAACAEAGLASQEAEQSIRRTIELYRRRGAIVHGGSAATPYEAAEFRAMARLALTGSSARGVFSGVVDGFALDKTSLPRRS